MSENSNQIIICDNHQSAAAPKRLIIVYRPPASLKPNPANPRSHTKKQVRQVADSIRSFGLNMPVLVDASGTIIGGHCITLAAILLGLDEIPTICIDHLNPAQAKALMIALNRLSDLSSFDDRALAELFRDLAAADLTFNIEDTGFTLDEIEFKIESLNMAQEDTPDPDDHVPTSSDGPSVSEAGDLWLLGENRVLHGDATKLPDIEKLMNGKKAAATFCDPPYGVDYGNSAKDKLRGAHRPILNDNLDDGFGDFLFAACSNILAVTDGAVYVCMSSSALHVLQSAFVKAGGHWSTFLIWAKQTFTLGRADYQRQYEPILYGWREGAERHWCGARDQGDVWLINKPVKNDLHPTMKPVELVMRALRNSSQRCDIILDTFLGSASTLIAAERTGRVCYGLELDLRYIDVACLRWQRHTGSDAIHAVTGKKFNDIAAEKGIGHDK